MAVRRLEAGVAGCVAELHRAAPFFGVVAWYFSSAAAKEHDRRAQSLELKVAAQHELTARARERAAIAERELIELKTSMRPSTNLRGRRPVGRDCSLAAAEKRAVKKR